MALKNELYDSFQIIIQYTLSEFFKHTQYRTLVNGVGFLCIIQQT